MALQWKPKSHAFSNASACDPSILELNSLGKAYALNETKYKNTFNVKQRH
jgi:hypothetical protein